MCPVGGRVTDALTGAPLEDVRVTVDKSGDTILTDAVGRYHFTLAVGEYNFTFRKKGYYDETSWVSIWEDAPESNMNIDRRLRPLNTSILTVGPVQWGLYSSIGSRVMIEHGGLTLNSTTDPTNYATFYAVPTDWLRETIRISVVDHAPVSLFRPIDETWTIHLPDLEPLAYFALFLGPFVDEHGEPVEGLECSVYHNGTPQCDGSTGVNGTVILDAPRALMGVEVTIEVSGDTGALKNITGSIAPNGTIALSDDDRLVVVPEHDDDDQASGSDDMFVDILLIVVIPSIAFSLFLYWLVSPKKKRRHSPLLTTAGMKGTNRRGQGLDIVLEEDAYRPGERVDGVIQVDVDVDVEEPKQFDRLELIVRGREHVKNTMGGRHGGGFLWEKKTLFEVEKCLAEHDALSPGRQVYPFSFALPSDLPPTHYGYWAKVEYTITARVDIPGALDMRTKGTFPVRLDAGRLLADAAPLVLQTDAEEGRPRLECVFDRDRYRAGETIDGELTVWNPSGKEIRKATIGFNYVQKRNVRGQRDSSIKKGFDHTIPGDQIHEGSTLSFRICVPDAIPGSYTGTLSALVWKVEVRLHVLMGRDTTCQTTLTIYQ